MRRQAQQFSLRVKTASTEMPSVEEKKEYTGAEARDKYIECEKMIWDLRDQNRDLNRRSHNDERAKRNVREIERLKEIQNELYPTLANHKLVQGLSMELFGRKTELRTRHHKRKHNIDRTGKKRKR